MTRSPPGQIRRLMAKSHFGTLSSARNSGISLFEVVLALVILVTSLAAIGQLISSGGRGAVRSRLLTQAVFLAESKMAEMASGAAPLASGDTSKSCPTIRPGSPTSRFPRDHRPICIS
jgi:Tfp pilus assembly protein PilV